MVLSVIGNETAITWIRADNLRLFLETVSKFVGYGFDEADWDAIRFGVQDTDPAQGNRYEYELVGAWSVRLALGRAEEANRLFVHLEMSSDILPWIQAFAQTMQCNITEEDTHELERLIEIAFAEVAYPGDDNLLACTPEHLAGCEECQQVRDTFRGKHWTELRDSPTPLPRYFAGLNFLTPQARWFYFPAYLTATLRVRDTEYLEIARNVIDARNFTVLQAALVAFVQGLGCFITA